MASLSVRPCQCLLRLARQQRHHQTPSSRLRVAFTPARSLRQSTAGIREESKSAGTSEESKPANFSEDSKPTSTSEESEPANTSEEPKPLGVYDRVLRDRALREEMLDGLADEIDPALDRSANAVADIGNVDKLDELFQPDFEEPEEPRAPRPSGFFEIGEEEDDDPGEDYDFQPDDISSLAHAELEQVRELRELERVISWDMPLLHWHAQPFTPPTAAQPLRWKYTTFLGEEHPAARKVVLDFKPAALPDLTEAQRLKLLKLLGARYNPTTGIAKMSSDYYRTAPQNKRHLGQLLQRVLAEARDPAETFEDIPLDTRHVRVKDKTRNLRFPEAWRMTEERAAALAEARAARLVDAPPTTDGRFLAGGGGATEDEFVPARARRRRT